MPLPLVIRQCSQWLQDILVGRLFLAVNTVQIRKKITFIGHRVEGVQFSVLPSHLIGIEHHSISKYPHRHKHPEHNNRIGVKSRGLEPLIQDFKPHVREMSTTLGKVVYMKKTSSLRRRGNNKVVLITARTNKIQRNFRI